MHNEHWSTNTNNQFINPSFTETGQQIQSFPEETSYLLASQPSATGQHIQPPQTHKRTHETKEIGPGPTIFFGRDTSYPTELNRLFKPLYCELCGAHLNSVKSAKIHYESKAHDKHITNWLAHHYTENGVTPPKVKRFVQEVKVGPSAFYCELCDLPLTSLIHAKQHYDGRRHNLVTNKISNPSGAGYYNEEGKWVRTATKAQITVPDDGRYGIGEAFRSKEANDQLSGIKNLADSTNSETTNISQFANAQDASTICKTCNISVTSAPQMAMHLKGGKHLKKLKELGIPPTGKADDTILANLNKEITPADISIYRTPSGCYYCKICNINVTDESSLRHHLNGKKHNKKAINAEIKTES